MVFIPGPLAVSRAEVAEAEIQNPSSDVPPAISTKFSARASIKLSYTISSNTSRTVLWGISKKIGCFQK